MKIFGKLKKTLGLTRSQGLPGQNFLSLNNLKNKSDLKITVPKLAAIILAEPAIVSSQPIQTLPVNEPVVQLNRQLLSEMSAKITPVPAIDQSQTSKQKKSSLPNLVGKIKHKLWSPSRLATVGAFVGLLLALLLPVIGYQGYQKLNLWRANILATAKGAMSSLSSGGQAAAASDWSGATTDFSQAAGNFDQVNLKLKIFDSGLGSLLALAPSAQLHAAKSGADLAKAGALSATLGQQIAVLGDSWHAQDKTHWLAWLTQHQTQVIQVASQADELNQLLANLDSTSLPQVYRQMVGDLQQQSRLISQALADTAELVRNLPEALGQNGTRRYLLVFQNNAEKRGSGGFMGSFAVLDVRQGRIVRSQAPGGGSYDTTAGLLSAIQAPAPLRLINPRWYFWDANWWPDWQKSARKIAWFYEHSDGSTVDGVISLTPTAVESLLRIVGPIDLQAQYGLIITADNFWEQVQILSERKPDQTKTPKNIIGDLLTAIQTKLLQPVSLEQQIKLLGWLNDNFQQKQILTYFTDGGLAAMAEHFGWDGKLTATDDDYLMVTDTNIGGGKSDRVIRETIAHQASLRADGHIIDEVTIKREHTGYKNQPLVGVPNVDWLRIYTPLGSQLLSSDGWQAPPITPEAPDPSWKIDAEVAAEENSMTSAADGTKIYPDSGKTVFANWSYISPGETAIINLRYLLPFTWQVATPKSWLAKIFENSTTTQKYSWLWQKQSGAVEAIVSSQVSLPTGAKFLWQYPEADSGLTRQVDQTWNYLWQN